MNTISVPPRPLRSDCPFPSPLCRCAGGPATLTIDPAQIVSPVSPTLYGLMTEEINHSYDGGLYAEMVRNRTVRGSWAGPEAWTRGAARQLLRVNEGRSRNRTEQGAAVQRAADGQLGDSGGPGGLGELRLVGHGGAPAHDISRIVLREGPAMRPGR